MLVLLLAACVDNWCDRLSLDCAPEPAGEHLVVDLDGDVWQAGIDCDDGDSTVHPGAIEACDHKDNDCDSEVDEDSRVFYPDSDLDGFGDAGSSAYTCAWIAGHSAAGGDCNDLDGAVHPGAGETCDGLDNDCDGLVDDADEDLLTDDTHSVWTDADGDGYGATGEPVGEYCAPPTGTASEQGDCDDADPDVHPGADDRWYDGLDQDCDGERDDDADGDGWSPAEGDCDDDDAGVGPEADEICDGSDQDCDGLACSWMRQDQARAEWLGVASGDAAGTAVGTADLDGDGELDLVVTAPGAGVGEVGLAAASVGGVHDLGEADCVVTGESTGLSFGWSVGLGQDLSGDGYADLLVGSPDFDGIGAAWLLAGPLTADRAASSAERVLTGGAGGDDAGSAVLLAPDLTGDGLPDAVVGAPGDATTARGAGRVSILPGPLAGAAASRLTLLGPLETGYAGSALSAGDIDGDGMSDLVVGAPGTTGATATAGLAYLVRGPVTADRDLDDADARLLGRTTGEANGVSVASGFDLDGDGADDLAVGAFHAGPGAPQSGAVYVVLGVPSGSYALTGADAELRGEQDRAFAGHSLAGGEDFDGDGLSDLLVGAWSGPWGADAGKVFVAVGPWSGHQSLGQAHAAVEGLNADADAGTALAAAPDLNGDGLGEVVLGAPGDDRNGASAGAASLVLAESW